MLGTVNLARMWSLEAIGMNLLLLFLFIIVIFLRGHSIKLLFKSLFMPID